MKKLSLLILLLSICSLLFSQSIFNIYPDSLYQNLSNKYEYGTFYVPKTAEAQTDFLNNGDHLNCIRLHIIESALNNSSDLNGTLSYLDNVSSIIQNISAKTDKVIFIFEKMPAWLSSSSDGSPAQTPGWFVLNTKPPANYLDWNFMVQQVTDRIVNTYGITNAHFEIWNEPDLGSWTGTEEEYFKLFQETYDAIKTVDGTIPVGGPATNHWANNINFIAPFGYVSSIEGEQSLIAHLIDSTISWSKPLDFISWHNFNVTIETHQNAINFITNKYAVEAASLPELILSEWNAPSAVRDTDLHYCFAIKNTISIKNSPISADVIAAWQDFAFSNTEFHADYGLLSYGAIRKPFFNAVKIASELKGIKVKSNSIVPLVYETSVLNDTLMVLITNYTPPAIVEALNHTLFEGEFNVIDLDNAGYIDINTGDFSTLESIYNGNSTIPNSSALNQAINNSIPIYEYYDSLQSVNHNVEIDIVGYNGNYDGSLSIINDRTNNDQYIYDSLLNVGYNQSSAIAEIQGSQEIVSTQISINAGSYQINMKPNSVAFFKIVIPGLLTENEFHKNQPEISVYPVPTNDIIKIKSETNDIGEITFYDLNGKQIYQHYFTTNFTEISVDFLPPGIYFIQTENGYTTRFIKE